MTTTAICVSQDDSSLNRKVVVRLIESEKKGRLKNARLLEADDGTTAVETLRREVSEGRQVDFVLMDYVMVGEIYTTYTDHTYILYSLTCVSLVRFACMARRLRASCVMT